MNRPSFISSAAAALAVAGLPAALRAAATGQPIKVAAVLSLSGKGSNISLPEKNTFDLLVKQLNDRNGIKGRPLALVYADDGGDEARAVTAAKSAAADPSIVALLGPSQSGLSLAMLSAIDAGEIPEISLAASAKVVLPVHKWIFKTPIPDTAMMNSLLAFASSQGWTKLAVLSDANAFGESERAAAEAAAPKHEVTLVAQEKYNSSDSSVATQLTKIQSSGAQGMLLCGADPGPLNAAKSAQQVGFKVPILNSGTIDPVLMDTVMQDKQIWYVLTDSLAVYDQIPNSDPMKNDLVAFADAYKKQYQTTPNNFAVYAHDAFNILVDALGRAGANPTRSSVRDAIESTKDFRGLQGVYSFSPADHNGIHGGGVVTTIRDGKLVLLKTVAALDRIGGG